MNTSNLLGIQKFLEPIESCMVTSEMEFLLWCIRVFLCAHFAHIFENLYVKAI